MFWTKEVEYGAARLEKKKKTTEEVHGCSEGGVKLDGGRVSAIATPIGRSCDTNKIFIACL